MGKKATFVIDEGVLEEAKNIVANRGLKSLNSFVENAVKEKVDRIRKEEIAKSILEAGKDPMFLSDIKDIESDFAFTDFEY